MEKTTETSTTQEPGIQNELKEALIYDVDGEGKEGKPLSPSESLLSSVTSQAEVQEDYEGEGGLGGAILENHRFRIPVDLELCEQHWNSGGVGLREVDSQIAVNQNKDKDFRPGKNQLKKFPFFTNPLRIKGCGTSIQIYFLFNLCCLTLILVALFGCSYNSLVFRSLYCSQYKQKTGKSCSLFDLSSYKVNTFSAILKGEKLKEFIDESVYGLWLMFASVVAMCLIILVFGISRVRINCEYENRRKEARISDFWIMVEGVDGNIGIEPVYDFIQQIVEKRFGKTELEVSSLLIASGKGQIIRAENQLNQTEKDLRRIKLMIEDLRQGINSNTKETKKGLNHSENDNGNSNQKNDLYGNLDKILVLKAYVKVKKNLSREMKQIQMKLENFKKEESQKKFHKRDKNSIALISYATRTQRDLIISAYNSIYSQEGYFAFVTSFFKKKPKFAVRPAPEPSEINWDRISYTNCQKITRNTLVRTVLGIIILFLIGHYLAVNILAFLLNRKFQDNESVKKLIHIARVLIIQIFTFITLKITEKLKILEFKILKNSHIPSTVFLASLIQVFYLYISIVVQAFNGVIDDHGSGQLKIITLFVKAASLLSDKILGYMSTTLFLKPLLLIFEFDFWVNAYHRTKIRRVLNRLKWLSKKKQSDVVRSRYAYWSHEKAKRCFARPEIVMELKYTTNYSIMLFFALTTFNAPILTAPLAFLIILITFSTDWWLVLSRSKKPSPSVECLGERMIRRLVMVPRLTIFSICKFLAAKSKGTLYLSDWALLALTITMFINVGSIFKIVENNYKKRISSSRRQKVIHYEDIQGSFRNDYQTLYKGLRQEE